MSARPTATPPRIVDLTLPMQSGMACIPKLAFYERYPVSIRAVTIVSEPQKALLRDERVDLLADAESVGSMNTHLSLTTHVGTHIDVPRHVYPDGQPVDQLDLQRLVLREALVLDVSHTETWLRRHGRRSRPHGAGCARLYL